MLNLALATVLAMLQSGAAGAVPDVSAADEAAIAMYESSLNNPGMYETCKKADKASAALYDQTLRDWRSRNQAQIARGRELLREDSARTGVDKITILRDNVTWIVADFARNSPYRKLERCETMLRRDAAPTPLKQAEADQAEATAVPRPAATSEPAPTTEPLPPVTP